MPTPAIASRLRRAPNPCTDLETFGGTQITAPCLRTLPGTGKPLRVRIIIRMSGVRVPPPALGIEPNSAPWRGALGQGGKGVSGPLQLMPYASTRRRSASGGNQAGSIQCVATLMCQST